MGVTNQTSPVYRRTPLPAVLSAAKNQAESRGYCGSARTLVALSRLSPDAAPTTAILECSNTARLAMKLRRRGPRGRRISPAGARHQRRGNRALITWDQPSRPLASQQPKCEYSRLRTLDTSRCRAYRPVDLVVSHRMNAGAEGLQDPARFAGCFSTVPKR